MAIKMFLVTFEADDIGANESFSELLDRHDIGDAELLEASHIDLDERLSTRDIEKAFG